MAAAMLLAAGCAAWPCLRRPSPLRTRPPALQLANEPDGHVFVVHGDVLSLSADALLVPTRNLNNRKWFPCGPPDDAVQPPREAFTPSRRVILVQSRATHPGPAVWLGHLDSRFAPAERLSAPAGGPELSWFLEAAWQFLRAAHKDLRTRAIAPRCGRAKHVLAMPVVGTGKGGARGSSGEMIQQLLQLLDAYVREHGIDVALVVKSDRMFSAAQAYRRLISQRWERKLGPRLAREARRLARLAASERLCLFLGAGVSVGAGLPEWKQLLHALASRPEVPLEPDEIRQLANLGLPDQAGSATPAPPTAVPPTTIALMAPPRLLPPPAAAAAVPVTIAALPTTHARVAPPLPSLCPTRRRRAAPRTRLAVSSCRQPSSPLDSVRPP